MRFFRGIYALILMLFSVRIFDPVRELKGKRVAIIGAADSVLERARGELIDSYDVVIRINKAAISWESGNQPWLGSKFTYLFHSFYENTFSGGGPVDWDLFRERGIEKLINPNFNLRGLWTHWNFYKRHQKFKKTYLLDFRISRKAYGLLEGWTPTVGFLALVTVLSAPCHSVYITGFTFFRSPYVKGYRDELIRPKKNKAHIEDQGLHHPDLEYEKFKILLGKAPAGNIIFDQSLKKLLKSPGS